MTESRPPARYVIVPKDGIDVLHRDPREQCNVDDATRKTVVDEATALSMKLGGYVRLCGHCYEEEPVT